MIRSVAAIALLSALSFALVGGCGKDSTTRPTPDGPPTWVASWGDSGAAPGPFGFPTGIAVGRDGSVYVANNGYGTIDVIRRDGTRRTSWGHSGWGDGEFYHPVSVAAASDGGIVVGDLLGRVQLFDSTGTFVRRLAYPAAAPSSTELPAFVDIDESGTILVCYASPPTFVRYSNSGDYESMWSPDSSGVRGIRYPAHVATTVDGETYVADFFGHAVRLVTVGGRLVRKIESIGSSEDKLIAPYGVDVDSQGRLFVTDRGADRVSVFDADGVYLFSWGKHGTGPGEFQEPGGIAVGRDGLIYVTDLENNRVQVFRWGS